MELLDEQARISQAELTPEQIEGIFVELVTAESWPWEGSVWGEGSFNDTHYDPELKGLYGQLGLKERSTTVYEPTGQEIIDPFDIDNLRFIKPEQVTRYTEKLNALNTLANSEGPTKKVVGLIGTGGTIAMVKEDGKLIPKLDAESFTRSLSEDDKDKFAISTIELPKTIDSSDMKLDFIADLVITMSATWNALSPEAKVNFAGFMITHGTDTMGASGAMITEMLGPNCPFSVTMVGAQKTTEDKKNDVQVNIKSGFESLRDLHDENLTARVVVLGGTSGAAFNASGVIKVSDTSIEAFDSVMHNRVEDFRNFADEGIDPVHRKFFENAKQAKNREFMPIVLEGPSTVEFIEAKPNSRMSLIRKNLQNAKEAGQQAVVLVTYGAFTAETALIRTLEWAKNELGLDVFAANPFPEGKMTHEYGQAVEIRQRGLVPVSYLKYATEYKYMVAKQMFGDDQDAIRAFMAYNDFAGETAKRKASSTKSAGKILEVFVTSSGTIIPDTYAPYKAKGLNKRTAKKMTAGLMAAVGIPENKK